MCEGCDFLVAVCWEYIEIVSSADSKRELGCVDDVLVRGIPSSADCKKKDMGYAEVLSIFIQVVCEIMGSFMDVMLP